MPIQKTMAQTQTVLILGSDVAAMQKLAARLRELGCNVHTVRSSQEAVRQTRALSPDLVLLGDHVSQQWLMEICRHVYSDLSETRAAALILPVLADGHWGEVPVGGDSAGNDTYLEQVARAVFNILSCGLAYSATQERVDCGGLIMDLRRYQSSIYGHPLELTPTEFRLLWMLGRSCGRTLSRKHLAKIPEDSPHVRLRTIDSQIQSLRRKLGEHSLLIETVRGAGYRLSCHMPVRQVSD